MVLEKNNLMAIIVKVLYYFGGLNSNPLKKTCAAIWIIIYLFLISYFILSCESFSNVKNDLTMIAESAETSLIYLMLIIKPIVNYRNRKNVLWILDQKKKYLPENDLPKEYKKNVEKYRNWLQNFYIIYLLPTVITTFFLAIKTAMGSFTFTVWVPQALEDYRYFLVICQFFTVFPCFVNIIGTDLLLLAMSTELMIQLRLLSNEMRNLKLNQIKSKEDELECNRKLKKCIKYHIFLLRILRRVQKVFSPILLIHPTLLCLTLCFETYVIMESLGDVRLTTLLIKSVMYAVTEFIEMTLYCLSSEYLTFEASFIKEGLYDSGWQERYLRTFAQSIPFIIMRSNKEIRFTASGLFTFKIRTILQVLKLTYSIFALLKSFQRYHTNM